MGFFLGKIVMTSVETEQQPVPVFDWLSFWQCHGWRHYFNTQPMLDNQWPVSKVILSNKTLTDNTLACKEGAYWLCPVFQCAQNDYFPLWLPVSVINHQLVCSKDKRLPWVPSCFWYPSSPIYIKQRSALDAFLQDNGELKQDENNTLDFNAWVSLFVEKISQLVTTSIEQTHWVLVEDQALHALGDTNQPPNRLLKHLASQPQLHIVSHQSKHFLDHAHVYQASFSNNAFSAEDYATLQAALSLKKGECQAIASPIGQDRSLWLSEYILNLYCIHALGKRSKPNIFLLTQRPYHFANLQFACDSESDFCQRCAQVLSDTKVKDKTSALAWVDNIHHRLKETAESIVKTIGLARQYKILIDKNEKEFGEVNRFLQTLLLEDDLNDEKRHLYLDIQNQWRGKLTSHTFLQRCVGWLGFVKRAREKKASTFLKKALENEPIECPYEQQLVEKIRSLKVIQAKNDRKRIRAVAFLNQLQKARSLWENWLAKIEVAYFEPGVDSSVFYQKIAPLKEKMSLLTRLYWQGRSLIESKPGALDAPKDHAEQAIATWQNTPVPNAKTIYDVTIIEQAQKYSAPSMMPLLQQSERLLALGDGKAIQNVPVMSATEELFYLQDQLTDEQIEQAMLFGHSISQGSLWQLALTHSIYRQRNALLAQANQSKKIDSMKQQKVIFIDVKDKDRDNHSISQKEATAIQVWLHANEQIADHILIVTPFHQQKCLLESQLSDGAHITVATFDTLPDEPCQIVIFSTVYQQCYPRPFIFDEGDAYLYSLLALCQDKLIVIGDKGIFQANRHSPSGKFAKWVESANQELAVIEQA